MQQRMGDFTGPLFALRTGPALAIALLALLLAPLRSLAEDVRRALVVIDMQEIFITRGGNAEKPKNKDKVQRIIEEQLRAIERAKRAGIPIIFIEYSNEGKTHDRLKKAAEGAADVAFFEKTTDGMLDEGNAHRGKLTDFLQKKSINTLVVTGANGGACVHDSIDGALKHEFSVVAYDNGIADFNFEEFLYPYDHYYKDSIHPACSHCTFRESTNLAEALPIAGEPKPLDWPKLFAELKELQETINALKPILSKEPCPK